MKRLLIAAMLFATPAMAEFKPDPNGWRVKAIEDLKSFYGANIAVHILWSREDRLLLVRKDTGFEQNTLANALCANLENSGKPDGEWVFIDIIDQVSAAQQIEKRLGKARCQ